MSPYSYLTEKHLQDYAFAKDVLTLTPVEAATYVFNNTKPDMYLSWSAISNLLELGSYYTVPQQYDIIDEHNRTNTPILRIVQKRIIKPYSALITAEKLARFIIKFHKLSQKVKESKKQEVELNSSANIVAELDKYQKRYARARALNVIGLFAVDYAYKGASPETKKGLGSKELAMRQLNAKPQIQNAIDYYRQNFKWTELPISPALIEANTLENILKKMSDKRKIFCECVADGWHPAMAASVAKMGTKVESLYSIGSETINTHQACRMYIAHLLAIKENKLKEDLGDLY